MAGPRLCVVHGIASPNEQHKLASRLGAMSVKSPFHDARWNYHVRFEPDGKGFAAFVDTKLKAAIDPELPVDPDAPTTFHDRTFVRVPGSALGLAGPLAIASPRGAGMAERVAVYPTVMTRVAEACTRLFPRSIAVISEGQHLTPVLRTIAVPAE